MLDHRNPKRDLFALLLLAACVFLTLSLFSYSFTDPPGSATYPVSTSVQNICGKVGAISANYLFGTFGFGAYFVLGTLIVIDLMLLARKDITEPAVRAVGWSLALAGIATLAALVSPAWNGPTIGPGGFLGAAGRGWLESHFASAGSYVLTISMILAGLLLCTDYVLLTLASLILGPPAKKLAGASRRAIQIATPTRRIATDVEEMITAGKEEQTGPKINKSKAAKSDLDNEEEAAGTGLAIKIRGKQVPAAAEVEDEEVEESEEEIEDSEEESEENDEPIVTSKNAAAKNANASATGLAPVASGAANLAATLKIKNLKKDDRETVMQELNAASQQEDMAEYELPSLELLLPNETVYKEEHEKEVRVKAKQIEKTFADFGFNVKVVEIETGPVIAQYEVELEAGLRLSKITGLADDLAISLRVPSVRIVAPIPGKNTVGIEVPNTERQLVRLREVIEEANGKAKKMKIPIFLGKDVAGNPLTVDLTTMPHLLIAGRTGTGKSVCLNSIIVSMLMTRRPDEVKMLMIDPKMVELSPYKTLPHLMHPVVTDMRKAEAILAWAVEKMEERYALLARAGVRHITVYNQLGDEELRDRLRPENDEEWASVPRTLPFIVIIADEIADLMMTVGKEVEQHIIRLAQKSRAVGIHLILATQKPTVDVITGLIKSNLPARIAFQVASRTDSRVVLDEMGADKLLGNGDMLFLWPGTSSLLRGQGTYLSDDEINKVVDFVGTTEPQFVKELVQLKSKDQNSGDLKDKLKNREELYESAVEIVIREGRGSVSLLQRALGIGYGRAARLVDFMAEDGIVGEYNGSQAREVIVTMEQWAEMTGAEVEQVEPEPPARRNRIVPERVDESDDDDGGGGGGGRAKSSAGSSKPRPHIPVAPSAPTSNAPFVPGGPVSPTNALKGAGATMLTSRTLTQLDADEEEVDDEFETEDAFAETENATDTAPWETAPEAVTDEWTGARKRSNVSSEDESDDEDCYDDEVNTRYDSESDEEEVDDDSDDEADLDDDAIVSRKRSSKSFDNDSESSSEDDTDSDEDSVSDFSTPFLKVAEENEADADEEEETEEYEDEVAEVDDELEQEYDEDETEEDDG